MANLNHSSTLHIGGRIAGSWADSVGAIRGGTGAIKKEISGLKDQQRGVTQAIRETEAAAAKLGVEGSADVTRLATAHKKLRGQQVAVEAELKAAQRAAAKLGKAGSEDVDRLLDKSEQLEHEERAVAKRLDEARKAAARFGIEGSAEVAKLRRAHAELGGQLDRNATKLKRVKAWNELDVGGRTSSALKRIGGGLADVGRYALYAGTALTATAAAGIGWFTKSALDAASSMEQLETTLVTLEGSGPKAKKAMDWISTFATETPYELEQVSDAFIRLRAYGIDATDGTLRTLGDTASAMGKDLMSSVEAIADAVTGENERLKEFGIRASKAGNQITYFYKNAAGEDAKKTVKGNSQEMIRATLMAIWNEKYAGQMDKQSRTWKGLMSNLSDQWTRFQVKVMQGGVFDLLKGKLEKTLAQVNKWADDGTLERWAKQIGEAYSWAFDRLEEGFSWTVAHWPEITENFKKGYETAEKVASWIYRVGKYASDAVGGPENLAKGLALLGAAKVLSPLGSLVMVGGQIVGWLSRAVGLTGALETGLSKAGGAIGGAAKGAPGKMSAAGTAARGALNAPFGGVGLGAGVAGASAGAIAGTVAAGAAIGVGLGMAIDAGVEAVTGKSLSTRTGEWLSSDVDKRRDALLRDTGNLQSSRAAGSARVNNTDNRRITINVEAKGADAEEVARQVAEKLTMSMRGEELASYG